MALCFAFFANSLNKINFVGLCLLPQVMKNDCRFIICTLSLLLVGIELKNSMKKAWYEV